MLSAELRPVGEVQPNIVVWVTAVAMVVIGVLATRKAPRYWRGASPYPEARKVFAATGEPLGTALACVAPFAGPATTLFGATALVLAVREVSSGPLQETTEGLGTLLMWPTFLALVVVFSIILFGRPKALIPPQLREHRGVIGEYLARSRASTDERGSTRR